MQGDDPRRKSLAAGFGFGDGSLVAIEHRQLNRKTELPLAVPLVPLVPEVTRAEMDIRILFCDLQLQRGLRGSVVGERAKDVCPAVEGSVAHLGRNQLVWAERLRKIERQRNPIQRGNGNAERIRHAHARGGDLPLGLGQLGGGFGRRHARGGDFGHGNRSRLQLAFKPVADFLLQSDLPLQQTGALLGRGLIEERMAQRAANLPGRSRNVQPRRLGEVFSLFDPSLPLSRRLDGQVKDDAGQPGAEVVGNAGVVGRRDGDGWIGPPAGGFYSSLGDLPVGPSNLQLGW